MISAHCGIVTILDCMISDWSGKVYDNVINYGCEQGDYLVGIPQYTLEVDNPGCPICHLSFDLLGAFKDWTSKMMIEAQFEGSTRVSIAQLLDFIEEEMDENYFTLVEKTINIDECLLHIVYKNLLNIVTFDTNDEWLTITVEEPMHENLAREEVYGAYGTIRESLNTMNRQRQELRKFVEQAESTDISRAKGESMLIYK